MWSAKAYGGYNRTSAEAKGNAQEMANTLQAVGWNVKAVCAMLGNGAGESGLNPWRWESDDVPTVAQYQGWTSAEALSHGYGLFGFTPASKYIEGGRSYTGYAPNFADQSGSPTDGNAQTLYFRGTVQSSWAQGLYDYYKDDFAAIGVNIDNFYFMSFQDFVRGTDTIENLVGAFELCYEKPADWAAASSYQTRVDNAKYWETVIQSGTLPLWLIAYIADKNRRYFQNGC